MTARSRAKEALVLVLAVTALMTAVFTFRHPTPPRGPRAVPLPAGTSASTGPEASEGWGRTDPLATMPATNGSRNPFTAPPGAPPIQLATAKSKHEEEPRPAAQNPAPVLPPVVVPPSVPTFTTVSQTQPAGAVQPAGVAPPAPSRPSLSGIVVDSAGTLTAVIREGDQRYFAKAGDKVAGKYRVKSITDQQVVLVTTRERLILKMGGS